MTSFSEGKKFHIAVKVFKSVNQIAALTYMSFKQVVIIGLFIPSITIDIVKTALYYNLWKTLDNILYICEYISGIYSNIYFNLH